MDWFPVCDHVVFRPTTVSNDDMTLILPADMQLKMFPLPVPNTMVDFHYRSENLSSRASLQVLAGMPPGYMHWSILNTQDRQSPLTRISLRRSAWDNKNFSSHQRVVVSGCSLEPHNPLFLPNFFPFLKPCSCNSGADRDSSLKSLYSWRTTTGTTFSPWAQLSQHT